MGLTDRQQMLIRKIAENDLNGAKTMAIACLDEDQTAKNRAFCNRFKQILSDSIGVIELPVSLKNILYAEDVAETFREDQYYLTGDKQELCDTILRARTVSQEMMRLGIRYPNTSLLHGESGTGKTMFGRYVAYRSGLPFLYMNFSYLVDSLMGKTGKNIAEAFQYAASMPCVLMLDEIDCISIRRSDTGSKDGTSGEMGRITITLLQELDRLPNDLIIIAATNRLDRMDEALLTRFKSYEFLEFNQDEKEQMIRQFLKSVDITLPDETVSRIAAQDEPQRVIMRDVVAEIAKVVETRILAEGTREGAYG